MKIAIVFGTRPEAIKLAPVNTAFRERGIDVDLISSGQHRELLLPLYGLFDLNVAHELGVMRVGQSLHELTAGLSESLGAVFRSKSYDYVLVQGDTTTAFVAALAAFHERIPVGHVEAGLRTYKRYSPFPEEINRRLISAIATDHFAPTSRARDNLLREAISGADVHVTGNTVVDALRWVERHKSVELLLSLMRLGLHETRYVLMTTHRRESIGAPMRTVLAAVQDFLRSHEDCQLVLPLHRNPQVRDVVLEYLGHEPRARLVEAQDYLSFCALMRSSLFIVTDSGGVQEEAPFFNKRTLVIRETTERPEAVEAGTACLVGTSHKVVVDAMNAAYREAAAGLAPDLAARNPFGDGHAAERIVDIVTRTQRQTKAPLDRELRAD